MIIKKMIYDYLTKESMIVEEEVEDKTEDIPIKPSVDEQIKSLQNVDTEHELAIVELANMIMDILGGGTNA